MVGSDAAQHKVAPFDVKTFQEDYLAPKGFYSPRSQQTPWHWVHPGTVADASSHSLSIAVTMRIRSGNCNCTRNLTCPSCMETQVRTFTLG